MSLDGIDARDRGKAARSSLYTIVQQHEEQTAKDFLGHTLWNRVCEVLGIDKKEFLDKKLDIDTKDMAEAPPLGQDAAEIVHSALSESGQSHKAPSADAKRSQAKQSKSSKPANVSRKS